MTIAQQRVVPNEHEEEIKLISIVHGIFMKTEKLCKEKSQFHFKIKPSPVSQDTFVTSTTLSYVNLTELSPYPKLSVF